MCCTRMNVFQHSYRCTSVQYSTHKGRKEGVSERPWEAGWLLEVEVHVAAWLGPPKEEKRGEEGGFDSISSFRPLLLLDPLPYDLHLASTYDVKVGFLLRTAKKQCTFKACTWLCHKMEFIIVGFVCIA